MFKSVMMNLKDRQSLTELNSDWAFAAMNKHVTPDGVQSTVITFSPSSILSERIFMTSPLLNVFQSLLASLAIPIRFTIYSPGSHSPWSPEK